LRGGIKNEKYLVLFEIIGKTNKNEGKTVILIKKKQFLKKCNKSFLPNSKMI